MKSIWQKVNKGLFFSADALSAAPGMTAAQTDAFKAELGMEPDNASPEDLDALNAAQGDAAAELAELSSLDETAPEQPDGLENSIVQPETAPGPQPVAETVTAPPPPNSPIAERVGRMIAGNDIAGVSALQEADLLDLATANPNLFRRLAPNLIGDQLTENVINTIGVPNLSDAQVWDIREQLFQGGRIADLGAEQVINLLKRGPQFLPYFSADQIKGIAFAPNGIAYIQKLPSEVLNNMDPDDLEKFVAYLSPKQVTDLSDEKIQIFGFKFNEKQKTALQSQANEDNRKAKVVEDDRQKKAEEESEKARLGTIASAAETRMNAVGEGEGDEAKQGLTDKQFEEWANNLFKTVDASGNLVDRANLTLAERVLKKSIETRREAMKTENAADKQRNTEADAKKKTVEWDAGLANIKKKLTIVKWVAIGAAIPAMGIWAGASLPLTLMLLAGGGATYGAGHGIIDQGQLRKWNLEQATANRQAAESERLKVKIRANRNFRDAQGIDAMLRTEAQIIAANSNGELTFDKVYDSVLRKTNTKGFSETVRAIAG